MYDLERYSWVFGLDLLVRELRKNHRLSIINIEFYFFWESKVILTEGAKYGDSLHSRFFLGQLLIRIHIEPIHNSRDGDLIELRRKVIHAHLDTLRSLGCRHFSNKASAA